MRFFYEHLLIIAYLDWHGPGLRATRPAIIIPASAFHLISIVLSTLSVRFYRPSSFSAISAIQMFSRKEKRLPLMVGLILMVNWSKRTAKNDSNTRDKDKSNEAENFRCFNKSTKLKFQLDSKPSEF